MKIIRSKIQPIGKGLYYYWADLSADKDGEIVKYYDSDTKSWLPLNNAENVQQNERLDAQEEQLTDHEKRIAKNAKDIADEIKRAVKAESDLQKAIDKVADDLDNFILGEDDLDNVINRWQEVVKFLQGIEEDETLSGIVAALTKQIGDEVTRAKSAEKDLQDQIDKAKPLVLPMNFDSTLEYIVTDYLTEIGSDTSNDITATFVASLGMQSAEEVYNFFLANKDKTYIRLEEEGYPVNSYMYIKTSYAYTADPDDPEDEDCIELTVSSSGCNYTATLEIYKDRVIITRASYDVKTDSYTIYVAEYRDLKDLVAGDILYINYTFRSDKVYQSRLTSYQLRYRQTSTPLLYVNISDAWGNNNSMVPISYVEEDETDPNNPDAPITLKLCFTDAESIVTIVIEQIDGEEYRVVSHEKIPFSDLGGEKVYFTEVNPYNARVNDTITAESFTDRNGNHPELFSPFIAYYKNVGGAGEACYPVSVNWQGSNQLYLRYAFVDDESSYAGDKFGIIKATTTDHITYTISSVDVYSPLDTAKKVEAMEDVNYKVYTFPAYLVKFVSDLYGKLRADVLGNTYTRSTTQKELFEALGIKYTDTDYNPATKQAFKDWLIDISTNYNKYNIEFARAGDGAISIHNCYIYVDPDMNGGELTIITQNSMMSNLGTNVSYMLWSNPDGLSATMITGIATYPGKGSTLVSNYSFSSGNGNAALGLYSSTIGKSNKVTNQYGIAVGSNNSVPAQNAMAIGGGNLVEGQNSVAIGKGLITKDTSRLQGNVVIGQYNKEDNTPDSVTISNGTSEERRTGISLLPKDSTHSYTRVYVDGIGGVDGENNPTSKKTLQEVVNDNANATKTVDSLPENILSGVSDIAVSTDPYRVTSSVANFVKGADGTYSNNSNRKFWTIESATQSKAGVLTAGDKTKLDTLPADAYSKSEIDSKLSSVYKFKGSVTFAELPTADQVIGDVYNITDTFVLNSIEYPVGTNVAWTADGWDALSGIFDSTELEQRIDECLPLTGGTVTGTTTFTTDDFGTQLTVRRGQAAAAAIKYENGNGLMGYVGINSAMDPYWQNKSGNTFKFWHEGNDGTGSKLDADLLDGKEAEDFALAENTEYTVTKFVTIPADTKYYRIAQVPYSSVCRLIVDSNGANYDNIYSYVITTSHVHATIHQESNGIYGAPNFYIRVRFNSSTDSYYVDIRTTSATTSSQSPQQASIQLTGPVGKKSAIQVFDTPTQIDSTEGVLYELIPQQYNSYMVVPSISVNGGTNNQVMMADGSLREWDMKNLLAYGVEWDVTVSNPDLTRIGNPLLHKQLPIQSGMKGCVCESGAFAYYLDPNDWTKKEDGTDSVLDGTNTSDVMVEIPEMYIKSEVDGNKRRVWITNVKLGSDWEYHPKIYVSAYRATADRDLTVARSIMSFDTKYRGGNNSTTYDDYVADPIRSNINKPATQITRVRWRDNYCMPNGYALYPRPFLYTDYKTLYWLMVIEYATFNLGKAVNNQLTPEGYRQGGLGFDAHNFYDWNVWNKYNGNNPLVPIGYLNEFGNFSGAKDITIPAFTDSEGVEHASVLFTAYRYRGLDMSHDIWTNVDGIILKRDVAGGESTVYTSYQDSDGYWGKPHDDDTTYWRGLPVKEVPSDGWIKDFALGNTAEIIPAAVGGNSTTYMCDHHWCNNQSLEQRLLLVGGCAHNGANSGSGSFTSNPGLGSSQALVGFRFVLPSKIY